MKHETERQMIRIVLPYHLQKLIHIEAELNLPIEGTPTLNSALDALESQYPELRGTIRDHVALKRRPFIRFYACERDLSNESPDLPLPEAVVTGREALRIIGAIAGG